MAKPLLIKTMKRIILGLIGVAVLAGMFWYINTYIYEFYASEPTIKIDLSEKATVKVGQEFNVLIGFPKNVESLDLVLRYDTDKLSYLDSVSSIPANYFKAPQKITSGSNTELRLIFLASDKVARSNNVTLNLKFKALKAGDASIAVDKKTVIAGVDNNNAVNYKSDLSKASKPVSIEGPVQGGTQELVGHWKMDDNVTGDNKRIEDSSGRNNHGTSKASNPAAGGGATNAGVDCTIAGKLGGACKMDGIDDHIVVPSADSLNFNQNNPFTIALWVRPTTTNPMLFVNKQRNATNEFTYSVGQNNQAKYYFDVSKQNSTYSTVLSTTNVVANQWTHLAAVSDGSKTMLYVNGALQGNSKPIAFTGATKSEATLFFGHGYNNTLRTSGDLDDIRIYNYALTEKQITDLANQDSQNSSIQINAMNVEGTPVPVRGMSYTYNCGSYPNCFSTPAENVSSYTVDAIGTWEGGGGIVLHENQVLLGVTPSPGGGSQNTKNNEDEPNNTWFNGVTWQNYWWPEYPQTGSYSLNFIVGTSTVPEPTPTPPWENTNYDTTTVYGIVQSTDESGSLLAGEYWRKDDSICANADYNNAPNMRINTHALDQCEGFNNIPYFLTVVQNPGNNLAYQLQNLPEGYECVGWEHRLRIKSDGKPFEAGKGNGCNTGPLNINVNNAESSYNNSHFILFKIRQIVEPTPTSPLEQFESVLNMKVRFQGIQTAPREQYRKLNARVTLKGGGQEVKTETIEFTAQEDGTWNGSMGVDGINSTTKYEVIIKGSKHLAKKICTNSPSEQLGGTYRCDEPAMNLQEGNNDLNFTGIILLGGDLPQQDGLINALDFAFIRQNLGSQDPQNLIRGDLNLDGIIDTQDHTIIKTALDFKYDEE